MQNLQKKIPNTVQGQPTLTVNKPGDKYEQEADTMANRVMRMSSNEKAEPVTGLIGKSLQRKCAHCEEEEEQKKTIMRKAENAGMAVSSSFVSSLNASKGGGMPLPRDTRSFMENAFSADFSNVRVHTDGNASEMSKGINAKAFTYGSDIYFNQGKYTPESPEGKRLLGHELTHLVQTKAIPLALPKNTLQRHPSPEIQSRKAPEEIGVTHVEGNGFIQRKETDETRDPTPEEIEDKEREVIEKAGELSRYINPGGYYSTKRNEWFIQVHRIIIDSNLEEDADISDTYSANLNALMKLEQLEQDIAWEVDEANYLLATATEKYEAELNRLGRVPSLSNSFALEALQDVDNQMNEAIKRITLLTQEDVLQYYNFLSNNVHIKLGEQKAESIRQKSQDDAEKLEESLASKNRGVFDAIKEGVGVVWDVVGCSSVSECALDIGLTVLTAGGAKVGRVIVKGGIAATKGGKVGTVVSKVTKARKITPKVATGIAERALKNTLNVKKLKEVLLAICSSMDTAGGWMKENMPQLMGEFVSGHIHGQPAGAASVVMGRIRKTQIESFYESILSRPDGSDVTWGVTALLAGRSEVGKYMLKTFLKQSITFRGAVNITEQLISNLPDSKFTSKEIQAQLLKSIRGALSNIVRESLQDIINNIPLGNEIIGKDSFLRTISEATLRSIQKSLQK